MSILGLTREANNGVEKREREREREKEMDGDARSSLVQQRIIIEEIRVAQKVSRDGKKKKKKKRREKREK